MNSKSEIATLAPFRLDPLFVERIWGTADLRPWYNYVSSAEPGHNPIGEVWLTGDECKVSTGSLAGMTLGQVFAAHSGAMLGSAVPDSIHGASPLLMKVIFAREKLSVQVHPDDRLAQKYGQPRGKTECWYALAAEPGAEVAAGLRPGTTLEQVESGVADGSLEQCLEVVQVTAGDLVYVDAGTVHAIWPGSVLLETQQNSDITYRLFDYGRPRELHVAKALEAIRLQTAAGKIAPVELTDRAVLVEREYFCVEKMIVSGVRTGSSMIATEGTEAGGDPGLTYLFAASGSGWISSAGSEAFEGVELAPRGMVAVPATSPAWQIEDRGGLELIRITPRFPATEVTHTA
ncbi:type I phosphomannose isomerase catalytic subunit [Acidicapsa acidisoli]|uniref:type I phosphomannose isomerase catalytic subunit n=1 Tax=Acidicapsa acidisoli TaxID=1615681 RepID=UPI0021DFABD1|nr:type I phosphomannose isomerase catalytic subunit [Acidicapsa acidisoli]